MAEPFDLASHARAKVRDNAIPMKKREWFRRTTWTADDPEDFDAHLKRSSGDSNKAQILRIQAYHLGEVGNQEGAIELLDRLFAEFPDKAQLAQAHELKGFRCRDYPQPAPPCERRS